MYNEQLYQITELYPDKLSKLPVMVSAVICSGPFKGHSSMIEIVNGE
jgi:hypothetical protein